MIPLQPATWQPKISHHPTSDRTGSAGAPEPGPAATEVIMRHASHVELRQVKNISARIDKICIERFETQILLPSQEHQKNLHSKKFQSILVCQNEFFLHWSRR